MNLHRERNGHQKLHAEITDIIISTKYSMQEKEIWSIHSLANRREVYPKSVENSKNLSFVAWEDRLSNIPID